MTVQQFEKEPPEQLKEGILDDIKFCVVRFPKQSLWSELPHLSQKEHVHVIGTHRGPGLVGLDQ